mmetsp:Transcript_17308/g.33958  ORF Transcript_17308/g.33958 Transcript_17308/m.33958 type:complete len:140 (-) Transcript_17308:199-618(-)|eukprot:CAMPEP_0173414702 /NCGR_PEP_ID=MMETSP1356-20130122/84458_1 /TAXON_ID=77927 ORGANISM="Hemiselmis virescens, Strain PCC157" /NCGR_SAMPLE_ID=MMETSP1356 /ASSEMBLY_ACC=CAM_ASM_000847 /LENGTH=139 /DNA_ID=CAMNT_0014376905 /DNA_START=96 /DNA_END=515 /DNA_ORIENTATION=-
MALLSYLSTASSALKPPGAAATLKRTARAPAARNTKPDPVTIPAVAEPETDTVNVSYLESVMFDYFGKDSLVIPLGCFVTTVVLCSTFVEFHKGNKRNAQIFMRARVVAQGVTVACMMTSLLVQQRQKALGLIPDMYNY